MDLHQAMQDLKVHLLYDDYNLYFLPITFGGGSLHSTKKITSVEDLNGLKIRAPQGMMADLLTNEGAAVTVITGGEVYNALEKGVVEAAQFGPASTNYAMGWHEVTDYIIWPNPWYQVQINEVAINMDAWESLPDDLKAIVERATRDLSVDFDMDSAVLDYEAVQEMLDYGNEWVKLPDDELAKLRVSAVEVWDEWAEKSPETGEIIESQKDFLRLLGIIE